MLLGVGIKKQILGLDSGVFYKECKVCEESKQSKLFRLRNESKNYSRRPFCSTCEKNKYKNNYIKNKVIRGKKNMEYRENNWHMKMLITAKCTAKRKNLEFNLEKSDIVIPTHCKYLNTLLTQELGNGVVWSNTSLDRIDSSLGYVKGNVEVISRKANTMKNMATKEELIIFAKNILTIYGK
jgi:hypothetical protein